MATDISLVSSNVIITEADGHKKGYKNAVVSYEFDSHDNLLLTMDGKTRQIALADLTVGAVAPADVDEAITALAAVFPNAGGSATTTVQTLTGLAPVWDLNSGEWAIIDAPAGNVSVTTSNVPTPGAGVLHFIQDSGGSRTIQINGVAVDVDPAADAVTRIDFSFDGTNYIYVSSYETGGASSGELTEYTGLNEPTAPATGVTMFAQKRTGNPIAAFVDPTGVLTELQAALFSGVFTYFKPTLGTTTLLQIGVAHTAVGTASGAGNSTGNYFVTQQRVNYASAAGAGNPALFRATEGLAKRGFGFFVSIQWGVQVGVANARSFYGIYSDASGAIGNVEPSTLLNLIGVGSDAGEANLSLIHNDGAGAATKTDLGVNFPANTNATDWYELRLFCYPNAASVFYSLHRKNTGNYTSGEITTDLPSTAIRLAPQVWLNNGATASAVTLAVGTQYLSAQ